MRGSREGFSLLEVVISLLILSVGVLSMGVATVYTLDLAHHSGLTTERNMAVLAVSEELRATSWSDLEGTCGSSTFDVGRFTVTCSTESPQAQLKRVQLVSVGPGYVDGGELREIADTTAIVLARPLN